MATLRHPVAKPSSVIEQAFALIGSGRGKEAVVLLQDTMVQRGPSVELLYCLGLAQQTSGDTNGAINSYQQCLSLNPALAEAHNNLGSVLQGLGRTEESIDCFRAALRAKPDYVRALNNLGNALRKAKQLAAAAESLERALTLAPDYPPALCNLGQVRLDQHRLPQAIDLYTRALALRPDLAEAHLGLGMAFFLSDEYARALGCFNQGIALAPSRAEAYLHRGRTLLQLERHAEALADYERALERDPESADTWHWRGLVLSRLTRFEEAIDSYERALALQPDYAAASWNQALLRLLLGDFPRGWALFESRFDLPETPRPKRVAACPHWRAGLSLRGKTIWVRAETGEHGLGDTLQFCRYLNLLHDLGARVIFEAEPPLRALIQTLESTPQLVLQDEPVDSADYHCSLMSLPLAFGTDVNSIPAAASGYLKADTARVAQWAARLGSGGLRVGVAWRGNTRHDTWEMRGRSIPLQQFAPLVDIPRVRLVALQKGAGNEELAQVSFGYRIVSFGDSLDPGPDAFLDTAALMMSLDLVITIDTAIAHLAGALGVPVWVALKTPCDWRWQLEREDCPWYPSMRLFRQSVPGDWDTVFGLIASRLACLSSGDGSHEKIPSHVDIALST